VHYSAKKLASNYLRLAGIIYFWAIT
jgi:hypothetical protein